MAARVVAELAAVLAANSNDAVTWIRNQDGDKFYQASSNFFRCKIRKISYKIKISLGAI
jgi:hypothetical protein